MTHAMKEKEHAWLEMTTRGWGVDPGLEIGLSEQETLEQRPEEYSEDNAATFQTPDSTHLAYKKPWKSEDVWVLSGFEVAIAVQGVGGSYLKDCQSLPALPKCLG